MKESKRTILYIDGENFKHYIKKVARKHGKAIVIEKFDFSGVLASALGSVTPTTKRYYCAKLRQHKDSLEKSQVLIESQRALKAKLENQNFTFIISGNVRGQKVRVDGKTQTIFKEKGVDVRIAVDMVAESCEAKVDVIVLCSSDSDLQPAIKGVKNKKVEIIYLGLESQPNKGLIYTCDRTILIRDDEIIKAIGE
jgi:uncharacterized LabA/DUF88 family protein